MEQEDLKLEDLIERYFDNELNPEELVLFEKKLLSDSVFAEEVKLHKLSSKAAKLFEPVYLKSHLLERGKQKAKEKKRRIIYWRNLAAAIIILVLPIGYLFLNNTLSNKKNFEKHFRPFAINLKRSPQKNEPLNYERAIQAYNDGEYLKAVELFQMVPESSRTDPFYMYISNALLATNSEHLAALQNLSSKDSVNYHPAVAYLQKLKTSSEYSEDAQWYLALAYLSGGHTNLAKEELKAILSKNTDQGYGPQAKKVLQKLNNPLRKLLP